ncbi:hypothetical protein Pla22_22910 [Rubripirellula amarantea]|uniref:DUF1559 domain-containing protein n=2 Tax=Rubripirellula amarantea TaxID=2527999 RepID=A0A5C5WWX2_9BACT|nr:hypothetical protein Pla22_22910 [Rubripirellula amarantea]
MRDYRSRFGSGCSPDPIRRSNSAFTLIELLVAISIMGILVSLTLNGVQAARESARQVQCSNQLRQQSLALVSFHSTWKSFPLGNDRRGGIDQAWSSAILPQLELGSLAEIYDRKLKWDAPGRNAKVASTVVPHYRCPTSVEDFAGDTDYAAVQGSLLANEQSFLTHGPNNGVMLIASIKRVHPVSFSEIWDGTSYTMILAEVSDRSAERGGMWADGNNVIAHDNGPVNVDNDNEIYSLHPAGAYVALADGSVRFITESIDLDTLGGLCSRDGREDVNEFFLE